MPVVIIDQAHWAQLEQVQSYVNNKVRYTEDSRRFGMVDVWEIADREGDCKDIALAKRQRLLELGWPPESLRMALAYTERGEMHAVLTVDVLSPGGRRGTYVLDNRFVDVEPWQMVSQYGYRWVERAGPTQYAWTYIGNPMTLRMAVAAAAVTTSVSLSPMASASITPATLAAAMTASAASGQTIAPSVSAAAAKAPSMASDVLDRSTWTPVSVSFSAMVPMTPIVLANDDPAPVVYWQARHSS
jgi:predicted transglutaminase-like cysteine proteinase